MNDLTARAPGTLDAPNEWEALIVSMKNEIDDFIFLAAQLCQTPFAALTFFDEQRGWFKSGEGQGQQTSTAENAFHAQTFLRPDEILEVGDALADPRFAKDPAVSADPRIRFYAGAALLAQSGDVLGVLSVMGPKPSNLSDQQRRSLRTLASHAVSQIELRKQLRELDREIAARHRNERQLRLNFDQLAANEKATARQLEVEERSRRALLSVLEDGKRSLQKLRASEEQFRQLTENISEVFWIAEPTKEALLYISPAYEVIWGRTRKSLVNNPQERWDSIHPRDRNRVRDAVERRQTTGEYNQVFRINRPDGSLRWIHEKAFPVRNERGEIYRIVGTSEDVTERKCAELYSSVQHEVTAVLAEAASLSQTARRLLEIVCRGLDWDLGDFWSLDRASKTLRFVEDWHGSNDGLSAFAEASRTKQFPLGEGLPGEVWETRKSHWYSNLEEAKKFQRRAHGTKAGLKAALAIPIKLRGEMFGVVEFFSKVSQQPDPDLLALFEGLATQIGQFIERKQLEDQFRQAQKMEAIGTLAGGVAHDFNNVLAAITGYTELARMQTQQNPEVSGYLQAVLAGTGRAADLVKQILTFSRLQEQQRRSIRLWPIVDEALKLLRATIPTTILFETSIDRHGLNVIADPTQVHQVIMNLVTNAAHAMRAGPGKLKIILESIDVESDLVALHPGLRVGPYLRLTVSDTGHGMDQATLSRIFDPFFTTKPPGEGTGLGLAVVHGIMHNHEGVITVYSKPGEGTQFDLYFPANLADVVESTPRLAETKRGQGECVLVVDDEAPLVDMTEKILHLLGYEVEVHTLPADALRSFISQPAKYDLVITDLTMPGMSGTDLSAQISKIRPDLPIILTTGYSATFTSERVQAYGVREMLLKPLTIHSLSEVVDRLVIKRHRK